MTVMYTNITQIAHGTAAEKAGALAGSAVDCVYFEDDTGLSYKKTAAGAWQQINLLGAGDLTLGRFKITDGADVALVDANGNLSGTRTNKSKTGTFTSDTDVIAAVSSKRLKVYALEMYINSTTITIVTIKSGGTAGTALWTRPVLSPAANSIFGGIISVTPPDFLFATVAGEKLTFDTDTGQTVYYNLSYWDDDAS